MLNNLLVGVQLTGQQPSGALYMARSYGIPPPYSSANVTIKPIASDTWIRGNNWKYTFLCSGCLTKQDGAFGLAYHATAKGIQGKHTFNGNTRINLAAAKTDGFSAYANGGAA
jgi:cellobiose dehydrogenase-like cytochrome